MATPERVSKWLFYLLIFPVVLGGCGWQGWQWWSWASSPVAPAAASTDSEVDPTVQLEIPSGTSAQQIGEDLEATGLIRSSLAWDIWTRFLSFQDQGGSFQAGTYELSPTQSLSEIASVIWQGQIVTTSITIPEGWSAQQMAELFEAEGYFSAEEFMAAAQQIPRDRFPWLPDNIDRLEGFLYPDTYQVPENPTPQAMIDQMLNQFQTVALPLYEQAQTPYSLLEWVTLSSIVEKEAVVDEERSLIASVFAKRLREGMALGADPTVEYGLGIRQTVENPLTWSQVGTPSPYNTYINPGLPPTPIASPGVASLEVSLNPPDTEFLYFVARYDGTHIFSRTLAEHEAAKVAIDNDLASRPSETTEAAN